MNTNQTVSLRRVAAGHYETRDGRWTVALVEGGWNYFLSTDPLAADRCDTLAEVRENLAEAYAEGL